MLLRLVAPAVEGVHGQPRQRRAVGRAAVPQVGVHHRDAAGHAGQQHFIGCGAIGSASTSCGRVPHGASRGPCGGAVVRREVVEQPDGVAHPVPALVGIAPMSTCSGCPASDPGSADRALRLLNLMSGPSTWRTPSSRPGKRSRDGRPRLCPRGSRADARGFLPELVAGAIALVVEEAWMACQSCRNASSMNPGSSTNPCSSSRCRVWPSVTAHSSVAL